MVWKLLFVAADGSRMEGWWDPALRGIGGVQLRGWSKASIGALNRQLGKLGQRP